MQHLLQDLNPEQQKAITSETQNILVLAGAGSGKTRVLTHRIAYLIEHDHISPYAILSVTFTNKAAAEMRGRIEELCQLSVNGMWVGTFHGLAHRFLRMHYQDAGLPESFQILDSDDQLRIVKRIYKTFELDDSKWPPKQAAWYINNQKENGRRSAHVVAKDYFDEVMLRVYKAYEDICNTSGLVDFSELLLRSLETLQTNEALREHYRTRFQAILIDEFQDTNNIQYLWLQTLASPTAKVIAVGDDDQSIYSWRGAKVENLQRFIKDFGPVETVRLEQNYRSTQKILGAANTVIANNSNRMGKNLWTEGAQGEAITLYSAFNERDEASYIVSQIQDWHRLGNNYLETAILYRSNAQSRILEEALLNANIPYRIYGGQKFFDRMEIKDSLGYLRVMANRHDDAAFERIINTPTRGIGNATVAIIRTCAKDNAISLWQAANSIVDKKELAARANNALQNFINLINNLETDTEDSSLGEQTEHMLHASGLMAHYQKDKSQNGQSRVENLQEFVNATKQFVAEQLETANQDEEVKLSPLTAFLAHVALETSESQASEHSDFVSLMTLHSAKGLEFPVVFIAGLEENLFPHRMSIEEPHGLEEERRLCYVGMTRAKKKLYLLHAESRRINGMTKFHSPSRFISEIPKEYLNIVRPTAKVTQSGYGSNYGRSSGFQKPPVNRRMPAGLQVDGTELKVGMRVTHKKFGTGVIINYEGRSEHARIQVKFDQAGTKWLVASYARLEVVS